MYMYKLTHSTRKLSIGVVRKCTENILVISVWTSKCASTPQQNKILQVHVTDYIGSLFHLWVHLWTLIYVNRLWTFSTIPSRPSRLSCSWLQLGPGSLPRVNPVIALADGVAARQRQEPHSPSGATGDCGGEKTWSIMWKFRRNKKVNDVKFMVLGKVQ